MHRPVEDGFEFELLTAPDGEIGFQKRTLATATQKQSLPNGRFNPRHIIIGKPPFPELEGAKVAAGEPPRELLAQAPVRRG